MVVPQCDLLKQAVKNTSQVTSMQAHFCKILVNSLILYMLCNLYCSFKSDRFQFAQVHQLNNIAQYHDADMEEQC